MDQEEAPPPPYTAVDPLLASTNNGNNTSQTSAPPGGLVSSSHAGSSHVPVRPTVIPIHFTSAASYFTERPPSVLDERRDILQHHMTIYPRSQAKDFPRRPRCWASRFDETTQQDWDTFLRYLFPPQLGLAASSQHLPRQLRAEIRRDRKDRPQETDEQRRARIAAVVGEWNECFFNSRGAHIVFIYVGEPDFAPQSALCPRCYPAATGSVENSPSRLPNAPSPVPTQYHPSPWPASPGPNFNNAHHPAPASPYGMPYGAPSYPTHVSPNHPPQYYPHPHPQQTWWNNWGPAPHQPSYSNNGTSKGGWFSQLTSTAQKLGEQAMKYGDHVSAQAEHYGRQLEEQALAHGRWLEEQAGLHGRKAQMDRPYGGNYYGQPAWNHPPRPPTNIPMHPAQSANSLAVTIPHTPGSAETTNQSNNKPTVPTEQPNVKPAAIELPRRMSVSSVSSESSYSSIDSISTSSDLDASDLATVRTQLELLDDRHDRMLYEAVLSLRQQLTDLKETRREARFSGKDKWKAGFSQSQQNAQQTTSSDWGRWDSPEQQQRNSVERRAMKDEVRMTKKVFRDAIRRARDEQRERWRKNRRQARQAMAGNSDTTKKTYHQPLEKQLETLRLEDSPSKQSSAPQLPDLAKPSVAASHDSNVGLGLANVPPSPVSPSAPVQPQKTKSTDATSRFKDMLKSRKAKKGKEGDAEDK